MTTSETATGPPDTGQAQLIELVDVGDLPQAVSWAAASRRTRLRLLVPFIVLCLMALPLVAVLPGPVGQDGLLAWAAALMIISGFQIVLLPWDKLPNLWRHLPATTFCVGVVLLRQLDSTRETGFGAVLFLLPIIWQAVYGRRMDIAIAFAQMTLGLALPVLLLEGYPVQREAPPTLLLLAVAAALGVVLRTLIATVRVHDRSLKTVVAASRLMYTAEDPRAVFGAAVRTIAGADDVVLFSLDRVTAEPVATAQVTASDVDGNDRRDRRPARGSANVVIRPGPDRGLGVPTPLRAAHEVPDGDALFERRPVTLEHPSTVWPEGLTARLTVLMGPPGGPVGMAEAHWYRRATRPGTFERTALALLGIDAGRAMERADLIDVLDDQAHRDELTALPNRRAWTDLIAREIAASRRSRSPLSVSIIDLDHFKRFNDEHGHLAGDDLLREAAAAWSATLRGHDALARWGGEEFALLLPGTDLVEAMSVVERMQVITPGGQTFSAGVAVLTGDDTADSLVAAADAAMYQAKAAGRNRVTAAVRTSAHSAFGHHPNV